MIRSREEPATVEKAPPGERGKILRLRIQSHTTGIDGQRHELPFGSLVMNALRLAERTLQRVGRDGPHLRGDADRILDVRRNPLGVITQPAAVPALGARFGNDRQFIHASVTRELKDEMAAAPIGREQHLLDLGRKQIDPAQDDHIV